MHAGILLADVGFQGFSHIVHACFSKYSWISRNFKLAIFLFSEKKLDLTKIGTGYTHLHVLLSV